MIAVYITLPLPPSKLSAHNSGSWQAKAKAIKWQRFRTMQEAKKVVQQQPDSFPFEYATLQFLFYFPDNIRRDETNYMQMLKSAVDGCVDAGVISVDCWQTLNNIGARSEVDSVNPRVVLVFKKSKNPTKNGRI